jgi:hypothetical protein
MDTELENSSNEARRLEEEDRGGHGLKTGWAPYRMKNKNKEGGGGGGDEVKKADKDGGGAEGE